MSKTDIATKAIKQSVKKTNPVLKQEEVSVIESITAGTAMVSGLSNAEINEILLFPNNISGMVQSLNETSVGVVFLDNPDSLKAGEKVARTGRILDVPVGDDLLGRVINPVGKPLDSKGSISQKKRRPIEVDSYPIMDRAPVDTPLQTGIKAIDSFTPVGRGQRELILGDRQTGKTAIALDTIINQKDTGVISIYCAIGQRASSVASVIDDLKKFDVMQNCVVVVATGDDEAGMQYIAPYAATSIGEYFMEQGKDVLIVYDDLTNHARAYREMSLLLRRPPGREAYPGDIFYIHSRLLERSTHLIPELGGGSLTSLPIVSTEAGNISAYVPTNIISITDGQIYLSAPMFQKGIMPAIDTGRSVSRVGGDAQLPAYKSLVGPLKLFYSQFEELESFTRFGTQMDDETQSRINRGRAIRLVLEQRQFQPVSVVHQIAIFMATVAGLLDGLDEAENKHAQHTICEAFDKFCAKESANILARKKLTDAEKDKILDVLKEALSSRGVGTDK